MNEIVNITDKQLDSLNQLVTEIKFFQQQGYKCGWEIGKRLKQIKDTLEHGNWINWISDNLGYSYEKAYRFITVYEDDPNLSNLETFKDLEFSKIYALTAIKDKEERKEFAENNNVGDISVRKLNQKIKDYKDNLKSKDDEIREYKASLQAKDEEIEILKAKDPEIIEIEKEIIKEVKPRKYVELESEIKHLESQNKKLMLEKISLEDDKKEAISQLASEKANENIIKDIGSFHYNIAGFIRANGGLLYLTDYLDKVDPRNQKLFLESIKYLRDFSNQLYFNVEDKIKKLNL